MFESEISQSYLEIQANDYKARRFLTERRIADDIFRRRITKKSCCAMVKEPRCGVIFHCVGKKIKEKDIGPLRFYLKSI